MRTIYFFILLNNPYSFCFLRFSVVLHRFFSEAFQFVFGFFNIFAGSYFFRRFKMLYILEIRLRFVIYNNKNSIIWETRREYFCLRTQRNLTYLYFIIYRVYLITS